MVRTGLKALAVLAVFSILPLLFFFALASLIAAAVGSSSTDGMTETATPTNFRAGERDGAIKLVSIPITGPILGEDRNSASSFFAPTDITYGYTVKEHLLELAEDDEVDGVLLEMSTPGGTIFGSKAIADGVAEYQAETGKPVVAYVADISASGGMYAMAGADQIVADHGTLIGSIGVIFGPFVHYDGVTALDGGLLGGGVTTENGITFEYLTAGRSKDFGSPYREMTAEERRVLQEGLDDAYDSFVAHVADGRDLTSEGIKSDLGALIFGEDQALKRGLIDQVGPRESAYQLLAELAGADGNDWRLDRAFTSEPGLLSLFGARSQDEVSAELPVFCTSGPALLAFHGDPSSMCTDS